MRKLKIILHSKKVYIILFIFLALYICLYKNILNKSRINENQTEFTCTILNIEYNGNYVKLLLNCKEKIIAYKYFDEKKEMNLFKDKYITGDKVKVIGMLKQIERTKDNFEFDYKEYLENNGIFYTITIEDIKLINRRGVLYKIRNYLYERVTNLNFFPYIMAYLNSNKTYFDNETLNTFEKLNITFLFSISSFRVIILVSIISKIFKIKDKSRLSLIMSFIYYIVIRNISLLRLLLYSLITFLNKKYKLELDKKEKIFWTYFIMLSFKPLYVFNIGFWYIFIVSSGLLLLQDKIYKRKSKLSKTLYITYLSFLLSLPLVIYTNYEVNILSLFFLPILSFYANFILFPLSIITFIFPVFDNIFLIFINLFESICLFFKSISICIILRKLDILTVVFYYVIVLLSIKNKKFIIILLMVLLVHKNYNEIFKDEFVIYIDVGQGDSILLHSKTSDILIDTGGEVSIYNEEWKKKKEESIVKRKTIPLLKMFGISNIDTLLLSHGDFDHMGEAINLVENFKVEKVIFNCGELNDLENELIKVLDKKEISYYSCIKELNFDNNKLFFLQTKEYDNENDNSNVIYTEINGYKFMFTGDAGVEKEKDILNKYNISDIDVLKVGHHGSKTSSSQTFVNSINPKYSIISVGKNNRYGHPNKEILNNLEQSKIYRTDQDGSIMFKIKNNKLKIETCEP